MSGRTLVNTSNPDEVVLKEFKALHPDFADFVDNYKVSVRLKKVAIIRFIVYCYDKNSHVALELKSKWINKKKEAAVRANFATFNDNGINRFILDAEEIIFGKNEYVNNIIIQYVALQFDNDFQMYMVYKDMLVHVLKELADYNFDNPGQVAKAKANAEEIMGDIERLENKMLSGDDVNSIKSLLYEEAYKSSLELRPEHIVTKKEQGKPVVDIKPYGDGYDIGKMIFIGDE